MLAQPRCMGGGGEGGGGGARDGTARRMMVEYQLVALNWLHAMHGLRLGCILADEMGLGKTVEAISLLAALRDAGGSAPHLVVAPVSVLENWLRELRTWCPAMRAAKYYGPQAQRAQLARDLGEQGFDVLVTSYSCFEGDSTAQVAHPPVLGL